jgi:hypothetical protein
VIRRRIPSTTSLNRQQPPGSTVDSERADSDATNPLEAERDGVRAAVHALTPGPGSAYASVRMSPRRSAISWQT